MCNIERAMGESRGVHHTETVHVPYPGMCTRMPLSPPKSPSPNPTDRDRRSSSSSSSSSSTSAFVRKAGHLVSNFLLRRKRCSTVLIASDDGYDVDLVGTRPEQSSLKPSVIEVPTPDRSNATPPSQRSGSGSGSGSDPGGDNNSPSTSLMESSQGGSSHHRTNNNNNNNKRHKTGRDSDTAVAAAAEATSTGTPSSCHPTHSKAYQATCYAILSTEGRQCSLRPLSQGRYCERHAPRHPPHSPPSDDAACQEEQRDQWFYGTESTTSRCWAMTGSQRRCQEMSVVHFDMCRRHLKYPPKRCFLPPPPPPPPPQLWNRTADILTPGGDDDDDDDEGSRSTTTTTSSSSRGRDDATHTEEDSEEETHLNWEDLSSHDSEDSEDSYDDGSSMSSSSEGEWEEETTSRRDRPGVNVRTASNNGHNQQNVTPAEPSGVQTREAKASEVSFEEPTEFDHSKDRLFSAKGNRLQCHYESSDGRKCPYQRKRGTDIYCFGHDILTPYVLARMAKSGVTVDSSEDDSSRNGLSSDDDDDDEHETTSPSKGQPRTYTHREFLKMWKNFEKFYMSTDEIENSKQVRSANQSMCPEDTDGQAKAQYGRLLPVAMKTIIDDILRLRMDDVFLDIGHGIGNTCMHAAFTVGCEARGIEVVYSRNCIAAAFLDNLVRQHRRLGPQRIAGEIKLLHGRLEEEIHREFLTNGVTKAVVNNFNGVFAERSVKNKSLWFLDDYCAGIFGLMAPGATMVTLHPLALGPSFDQANTARRKHKLPESSNASFYSVERIVLGKACDTVKWNQKSGNENLIYVYKYTRLHQDAGTESVFLCCNPHCKLAMESVAIPATTMNDEGRCVINRCGCGVAAKMLRQRKKVVYN